MNFFKNTRKIIVDTPRTYKNVFWLGRSGFNLRLNHTKDSKMVLDASLLKTQHYKVWIKSKLEQPEKGVAPLPTPWCGSYWKGSLRVTLVYCRQLYIFTLCLRGGRISAEGIDASVRTYFCVNSEWESIFIHFFPFKLWSNKIEKTAQVTTPKSYMCRVSWRHTVLQCFFMFSVTWSTTERREIRNFPYPFRV